MEHHDGTLAATGPAGRPVTATPSGSIEGMTTEDLVHRARSGDREAYGMLFHRYHDEIYRYATRRLGDHHLGQDAAADTFADAFGAIGRFRWKGVPFEAWLYTIARRRIADQNRRRIRVDAGAVPDRSVPDATGSVIDAVHVRALLDRLPEQDRDVLELRFMEDLDVEQTAMRVGKTPGAVRVQTHRALMRLRTIVAEGVA